MPKVGIRPAIDGRLGGVRESLENQTMEMAKSAVRLITDNLRHYNGMPVVALLPTDVSAEQQRPPWPKKSLEGKASEYP